MRGTVKINWNSKEILDEIRAIAATEETASARRIFSYAVKDVPYGHIVRFQTARSKKWKWYYNRTPGTLMRSIKNLASKFKGGGKIVLAGDERLAYYAHFVEYGTVFSKKRGGSRFLRKSLLRERRRFRDKVQSYLQGDMK